MSIRKTFVGFSASLVALSQIATGVAVAANFEDVPSDHWANSYVNALAEDGVIDTADNYRPNDGVTRAELVKMAMIASGREMDATGAPTFNDVDADQWYYEYVMSAAAQGIVEGYRDADGNATGYFGPGDPVTRAEAAKILFLAFELPLMLTPAAPFVDVEESQWYYSYVTTVYNADIVGGYKDADGELTGYYGPGDYVTRGQMAKMVDLSRSYDGSGDDEEGDDEEGDDEEGDDEEGDDTSATSDGTLVVELSSSSPSAQTIPASVPGVPVAAFDFTASGDEVIISSVAVHRVGIGDNADIDGLYLYDGDVRLTSKKSLNSTSNTATFNTTVTVPAGETKTLTVRLATKATVTSGEHAFEIESVDAVTANVADGEVDGDFPVTAATMSLVNVPVGSLTMYNDGSLSAVKVGETGVNIGKFKLTNGSVEDAYLKTITLKEIGTVDEEAAFANVELYADSVKIADGVRDGRYFIFAFEEDYLIEKSKTEKFRIKADIVAEPTKLIGWKLDNTVDIESEGATYGYSLSITDDNFTSYYAVTGQQVSIEAGAVTITENTLASDKVRKDKNDVELASFTVLINAGKDIELDAANLTLRITDTDSAYDEVSGTDELEDLFDTGAFQLVNVTTGQVEDLDVTNADLPDKDNDPDTYEDYVLSKSSLGMALEDGKSYEFRVEANTQNTSGNVLVSNYTYAISSTAIGDGTTTDGLEFRELLEDTYVQDVVPSSISFNTIEGISSAFTVNTITQSASYNAVIGTKGVNVYEFQIEETAGAADLEIKELKFKDVVTDNYDEGGGDATDNKISTDQISKFELFTVDGATETSVATQSTISSEEVTFDSLSIPVPQDSKTTFRLKTDLVKVDTSNGYTAQFALSGYGIEDDDNTDVYNTTIDANSDGITDVLGTVTSTRVLSIAGTGILYASANNNDSDSGTDRDKYIVFGDTDPGYVYTVDFLAENENILIEDFTITFSGTDFGGGNIADTEIPKLISSIEIYDGEGGLITSQIPEASLTQSFTNIDETIEKGSTRSWYVKLIPTTYAKDTGVAIIDQTGLLVQFDVDKAKGASSDNSLVVSDGADAGADGNHDNGEIYYEGDAAGGATAITAVSNKVGFLASAIASVEYLENVSGITGYDASGDLQSGTNTLGIIAVTGADWSSTEYTSGSDVELYIDTIRLNTAGTAAAIDDDNNDDGTDSEYTIDRYNGVSADAQVVVDSSAAVGADGYGTVTFDLDAASWATDNKIAANETAYFVVELTNVTSADNYYVESQLNALNNAVASASIVWKDALEADPVPASASLKGNLRLEGDGKTSKINVNDPS